MTSSATPQKKKLLSVVILARDEEGCVAATVEHLQIEPRLRGVPDESDDCRDVVRYWDKVNEGRKLIDGCEPLITPHFILR